MGELLGRGILPLPPPKKKEILVGGGGGGGLPPPPPLPPPSTSYTYVLGFIQNTSGGSFFFFSNLYVWSDLLCEYAPEGPGPLFVDADDLGVKCNTNHICHIWKRKTV